MTRTDDVLNCAGHWLSTGRIEEVVNSHPYVVESACIALFDELKTEIPFVFIIVRDDVTVSEEKVIKEVDNLVKHEVGAFSALGGGLIVPKLPKTWSGKILWNVLKKMANKMEYKVPPTIDDELVLEHFKE